jgi:hypothetical protein
MNAHLELSPGSPCRCTACGRAVDGAHECASAPEPAKSRLYETVFYTKRHIAIRAAVRRRRGR